MNSGVIRHWGNEFQVRAGPQFVDVFPGMVIFPNGQTWAIERTICTGLHIPQDDSWHTIALQVHSVDNGGWLAEYTVLPGLSYDYDYDKVVLAQARWGRGYIDIQDRRTFVHL